MYRLALDIGTNSIGWCRLSLDGTSSPNGILDAGVRIFPSGRTERGETSLAVERRLARQARRRRDRLIRRRSRLMKSLIRHGLMPEDATARKALESLDPYDIRSRALREPLSLYEFGRAIFHLNQRRGFRSSRKVARDSDAPKIKPAIDRLRQMMGDMTYGQFLHVRRLQGLPVRARKTGEGKEEHYDFYPQRGMIEEEFERLWNAQTIYHESLTEEIKKEIYEIIFFQRPLRPVRPGRCTFEPTEERCPAALPLAQRFRILQELNHLRVVLPNLTTRSLSLDERNKLFEELLKKKTVKFERMRRLLRLLTDTSFNLEGLKRQELKGDETGVLLGGKKGMGVKWFGLSLREQTELVRLLLDEEDEEALVATLINDWNLSEQESRRLADIDLPSGYSRLSEKSLNAIVPQLEKEVIPYSEAVTRAGYSSHSELGTGELFDRLPYYGIVLERHVSFGEPDPRKPLATQFGRIANPSVHIALNQLRRVVNELIKIYGPPDEVVLEVARDLKNSPARRREIEKEQAQRQKENEMFRQKLRELNLPVEGDGVLRLRLWEELHPDPAARRCPFTGEPISINRLFSGEVEIEHLLPFSRTLDDSISNKTVCLRRANDYKGNRTPFEAFGSSPAGYDWQAIMARVANLPRNKRWRFAEDAMQQFEKDGDFLARQLKDTQYISRLAREYLCAVCPPNKVWSTKGRFTRLLGRRWGLPEKDRNDHRHHALDAILIGLTDRRRLKVMADTHRRNEEAGVRRFLVNLAPPWPEFRTDTLKAIDGIVVSHRPDHGIQGQLHNETAYGMASGNDSKRNAEHRVPVAGIKTIKDLLPIKGKRLRADLLSFVTGKTFQDCKKYLDEMDASPLKSAKIMLTKLVDIDDKVFADRTKVFFGKKAIRRVRIAKTLTLIPIRDRSGKPYKGFKGDSNAYYDIFLAPDGKWVGTMVSTFDANQKGFQSEYEKLGYPRLTRLFKNDMLEITHEDKRIISYVVRLSEKQIALAEHNEANVDKRYREKNFSWILKTSPAVLQKAKARLIHVTPAGRLIYLEKPDHAAQHAGDRG